MPIFRCLYLNIQQTLMKNKVYSLCALALGLAAQPVLAQQQVAYHSLSRTWCTTRQRYRQLFLM